MIELSMMPLPVGAPVGSFEVVGIPMPQGSKTPLPLRGTKEGERPRFYMADGRSKEARMKFSDWRARVAFEAQQWLASHGRPAPLDGGVHVEILFFLPRPVSLPKKVKLHTKKPDLDKLTRAIGDSLSKVIYADDAHIVSSYQHKAYAVTRPPGAIVAWWAL